MEHAPRPLNVFTTIIICALCTLGSADEEFPARSIQFVEKYADVTSYKHDWCDIYGNRSRGELTLALEGRTISVLWSNGLSGFGWLTVDKPQGLVTGDGGYFYQLMTEVARRGKFEFAPYLAQYPDGSNESWTAWLNWAVNHFDSTGDWFTPLHERKLLGVGFHYPFLDISTNAVTRHKDTETPGMWEQFFSWGKPFSVEVWLSIAAMLIYSGFIYYYLEVVPMYSSGEIEDEEGKIDTYKDSMYTAVAFYVQSGQSFTPETTAGRTFVIVLSWCVLLLGSTYTANLANILIGTASKSIEFNIDTAASLGQPLCVRAGTAQTVILRQQYPTIPQIPVDLEKDGLNNIRQGICAAHVIPQFSFETIKGTKAVNGDCSMQYAGRPLNKLMGGWASNTDAQLCTQMVTDVISVILTNLDNEGWIEKHFERELEKESDMVACGNEPEEKVGVQALTLSNVGGIFLQLVLVGLICGAIRSFQSPNQMSTLHARLQRYIQSPNQMSTLYSHAIKKHTHTVTSVVGSARDAIQAEGRKEEAQVKRAKLRDLADVSLSIMERDEYRLETEHHSKHATTNIVSHHICDEDMLSRSAMPNAALLDRMQMMESKLDQLMSAKM